MKSSRDALLYQPRREHAAQEIGNLQHFFARRQKAYERALRDNDHITARKEIQRLYEEIRTKVVSEIRGGH